VAAMDNRDVPLRPRPSGSPGPLTALQLRAWDRAVGRLSSRLPCAAVRLLGRLDTEVLRLSIEHLLMRHESLRTRIVVDDDGVPVQQVDPPCRFELQAIQLAALPAESRETQARRLAQDLAGQKVDLSPGPMLAVQLLRLSEHEHVLIMAADHTFTDGFSFEIINREIWNGYLQTIRAVKVSLPRLPIQFADYALWQQQTRGEWEERHAPYWRKRLRGAPPVRSPFGGVTPSTQTPGAVLHFPFGSAWSTALRELARRERVDVCLVVMTLYVALWSRWIDQRDLLATFITHGRDRAELANMIGSIAGYLYLRLELANEASFADLLRTIEHELTAAKQHRDFDRVPQLLPECDTELHFNWLPTNRTVQWLPLNSTLNWLPAHLTQAQPGNGALRMEPFALQPQWSFTFDPMFHDSASGIHAIILHQPHAVPRSTLDGFTTALHAFGEQFIRQPRTRISSAAMS
jgi:hypothetical protein